MEALGTPPSGVLEQASRRKNFFDENSQPRLQANSRGKTRQPGAKSLAAVLRCPDSQFMDLIGRCLCWDPAERLTPEQALAHPWIGDAGGATARAVASDTPMAPRLPSVVNVPVPPALGPVVAAAPRREAPVASASFGAPPPPPPPPSYGAATKAAAVASHPLPSHRVAGGGDGGGATARSRQPTESQQPSLPAVTPPPPPRYAYATAAATARVVGTAAAAAGASGLVPSARLSLGAPAPPVSVPSASAAPPAGPAPPFIMALSHSTMKAQELEAASAGPAYGGMRPVPPSEAKPSSTRRPLASGRAHAAAAVPRLNLTKLTDAAAQRSLDLHHASADAAGASGGYGASARGPPPTAGSSGYALTASRLHTSSGAKAEAAAAAAGSLLARGGGGGDYRSPGGASARDAGGAASHRSPGAPAGREPTAAAAASHRSPRVAGAAASGAASARADAGITGPQLSPRSLRRFQATGQYEVPRGSHVFTSNGTLRTDMRRQPSDLALSADGPATARGRAVAAAVTIYGGGGGGGGGTARAEGAKGAAGGSSGHVLAKFLPRLGPNDRL